LRCGKVYRAGARSFATPFRRGPGRGGSGGQQYAPLLALAVPD
jgi:hypothetical protein